MKIVSYLLNQGWFIMLISGMAGALFTFIIGYIFYRKSQVGASLSYQTRSLKIIEKSKQILPKEIKIFFGDKIVTYLAKTDIIVWNSGKTTLRGNDIVHEDLLRLEFDKEEEVLQSYIMKITRDVNKFTSEIRSDFPNIVDCNFDFLDPGDGAVIEILHTDKELYPAIRGTIRGLSKGIIYCGSISSYSIFRNISEHKSFRRSRDILLILMSTIIIISGCVLLILYKFKSPWLSKPIPEWLNILIGIFTIGFGLFFLVTTLSIRWFSRIRFPKSLIPKDI